MEDSAAQLLHTTSMFEVVGLLVAVIGGIVIPIVGGLIIYLRSFIATKITSEIQAFELRIRDYFEEKTEDFASKTWVETAMDAHQARSRE